METLETAHFIELTAEKGHILTVYNEGEDIRCYHSSAIMIVPTGFDTSGIREITEAEDYVYREQLREWEAIRLPDQNDMAPASDYDLVLSFSRKAEIMRKNIQHLALSDSEAIRIADLYPEWRSLIGKIVDAGFRCRHQGHLYEVVQVHTAQTGWEPSPATMALYKVVTTQEGEESGTIDDPIAWASGMETIEGKYYAENGIIYRGGRSSGTPMPFSLSELVPGGFVEKVDK